MSHRSYLDAMMSEKTSSPSSSFAVRSFYGESPPKRSRLHDDISKSPSATSLRPNWKTFSDNAAALVQRISESEKQTSATTSTGTTTTTIELKPSSVIPTITLGATIEDEEDEQQQPLPLLNPKPQPQPETSEPDTIELFGEPEVKCLDRDSPVPLKNLGNTCYENSIIQCLFNLNMFMSNFESSMKELSSASEEEKGDVRFKIANALERLYKTYTSQGEQSEVESRLEELKSAVGERSSQFNSTHQQDASEFLYHVIDSIQEFYQSLEKTNDDDNPVTKAFELELDYLVRCPKCQHRIMSNGPEKIRTLPLTLPHINTPEELTVNNDATSSIPTPPTSDLGLDSPKSNQSSGDNDINDRKDSKSPSVLEYEEKEDNIANQESDSRSSDNDSLAPRVDSGSPQPQEESSPHSNTNRNNTMSIANLELSDKPDSTNNQNPNTYTSTLRTTTRAPITVNVANQPEEKHYTLSDALNNYFKDDLLEYSCSQPGCDSKHRTRKCLIRKLPQVLFITLARYSYTGKKSLDEIEAPFELSVPFQENKSPSHSPSAHRDFHDDDNKYQLLAVVCHLGSSLNAGHYTSYVYNQNNFSWYSCDDDSITKVQEADVKSNVSKCGYCFFYAHKSLIAQKEFEDHIDCETVHDPAPTTSLSPLQTEDPLTATSTITSSNQDHYAPEESVSMVVSSSVADSSIMLTPNSSPRSLSSPKEELKSVEMLLLAKDDLPNQLTRTARDSEWP